MPDIDPATARLHEAVGRAISTWARVEEELTWVAIHCFNVTCDFSKTQYLSFMPIMSAAFSATTGFRTRMDMTDAVVRKTQSSDVVLNHWEPIAKKVRRVAKRRNKIAHYVAYGNKVGGEAVLGVPFFDQDWSVYDEHAVIAAPSPKLTAKDIEGATAAFIEARARLSDFRANLRNPQPRRN